MKKIAILQSNYIPWKGYFDLINMVDEFIIFDDVQYTKNDWRNRNKIKTSHGLKWLTIPVSKKSIKQLINETLVTDSNWAIKHWKTIRQNYSKAPYFKDYKDIFEEAYLDNTSMFLSEINLNFIKIINSILNIETKITHSDNFELVNGRTEKIINICKLSNADIYVSGPSAQCYFDTNLARQENILVEWMSYNNYPEYNQRFPPFKHQVSILDLIFNEGIKAKNHMKSFY